MNIQIRDATANDLEAINAIYNHYVGTSTCTYQEEPATAEERSVWFAAHGEQHPVTVAVDEAEQVIGWASLNRYHARSAYRFTVENSVYVHCDFHRRRIGQMLLEDLLMRAKTLGHRTVIAGISADQAASVALHKKLGFTHAGLLRQVGFKFNRWLDVI